MDAVELIHTRYSVSALGAPAPPAKVDRSLLERATDIPDPGRLLPWRLLGVEVEVRARLGAAVAGSLSLPA